MDVLFTFKSLGQIGIENDPMAYGFVQSYYEPMSSHMKQLQIHTSYLLESFQSFEPGGAGGQKRHVSVGLRVAYLVCCEGRGIHHTVLLQCSERAKSKTNCESCQLEVSGDNVVANVGHQQLL